MTHDPYDIDNRTTTGTNPPEDPYIRSRTGYGSGSGIAFVIFGVVAVLLIGFAMFGGYSDNNSVSTPQTTTTEQQAPQAQPEQPQPAPAAPSTTGSTNQ
ncbi:MAG: hypothetical protein ACREDW_07690 [Aestuariivirgaceae bacterium]